MTVRFTEDELQYIKKEKFHWTIRDDCPAETKKRIGKKLRLLYDERSYNPKPKRR